MTLAPAVKGLNPARLCGDLAALFPAGVVAAQMTEVAAPDLLTAPERDAVSHCAEKRILDFTAGRLCARRALQELGVTGFSLLPAPDRQPLWPDSLVGSITHTQGYSAAVVGRGSDFRSLGVDAEAIASVHAELWPRVCSAAEFARLQGLPAVSRPKAAALIFAAKESFYKCQYPLTGEWLEFEDIEIEPGDWDQAAGRFTVRPRRPLRLDELLGGRSVGRFRFHGQFVSCGVALPV